MTIFVNGKEWARIEVTYFDKTYRLPFVCFSKETRVKLKLDRIFGPGITNDSRELGVIVRQLQIRTERDYIEKPALPSILEIESTTVCNINPPCVICYGRILPSWKNYQNQHLDQEVFNLLIPILPDFKTVSLSGIGEPLTGDIFFKIRNIIDMEKTHVQFTTNGLLLDKNKIDQLIELKLGMIDFSLDAATEQTYRKIRRSDFHQVISNIKHLTYKKKEYGVDYPRIMINMTIMKENVSEALSFIDLAKDLGADVVRFGSLNPCEDYSVENDGFFFHYKRQMIDPSSKAFQDLKVEMAERARKLGLTLIIE